MKTYRYSGHSRSDPATYRPPGELDAWLKRDPIDLFANKLVEKGVIANDDLDKLREQVTEAVERATTEALAAALPETGEMFAHVTHASGGGDNRWNFWSKSTSSGRPTATRKSAHA
jgi:TPP-dependent pyruvate/acetoin dehydrogenase alpha subunit